MSSISLMACNNETTAEDFTTLDTSSMASDIENVSGTGEAVTMGGTTDATVTPTAPAGQDVKPGENPYAHLKGNNPEHGQPNHRCDINVGEPLNTPPRAAGAPQTGAPQTIQMPTQAAPAPQAPPANIQTPSMPAQKTAAGFSGKPNPAHGQPGHRCDIKEGDILP